jgi:hypothetical protein
LDISHWPIRMQTTCDLWNIYNCCFLGRWRRLTINAILSRRYGHETMPRYGRRHVAMQLMWGICCVDFCVYWKCIVSFPLYFQAVAVAASSVSAGNILKISTRSWIEYFKLLSPSQN